MNAEFAKKLKNINWLEIPYWQKINETLATRFDAAIPHIGAVRITSTWRPAGSSAASYSLHSRGDITYAIDFDPEDRPMWHVYEILKRLGWGRVGLSPGQGIIHVDIGDLVFGMSPYYFLEDAEGRDLGPLDRQPIIALSKIPGYGTEPNDTLAKNTIEPGEIERFAVLLSGVAILAAALV